MELDGRLYHFHFYYSYSTTSNHHSINTRPTNGGGYHPPNGFSLLPQNTNQCGLRLLGNCLFIFCAHFEVKNLGYHLPRG